MFFALALALAAPDNLPEVEILTKAENVRALVTASKGKVVVLKLWATWCESCVRQFPELVRSAKRFPESAVRVITVSVDERGALDKVVRPFLQKQQATFPAYLLDIDDPSAVLPSIDKGWDGTLPATFVFDRDGALKKRYLGNTAGMEAFVLTLSR